MTKKWNLIVDVANCTNCNVCTVALHDEHVGNAFPGYAEEMPKHGHRWIDIKRRERGAAPDTDVAYLPTLCQHCDDAPCIAAAPDVIAKRADGIVLIDPVKSKGRRDLIDACPYGAIWWNEEKDVPQHWFFDAHLLDDGWAEPRCVTVCATNALKSVKLEDAEMKQLAETENLEPLRPDLATAPRVYYKNLWRYNSAFIAGTVSYDHEGRTECLEGAEISLVRGGEIIATLTTDIFGDFKFDRLDADGQDYEINVKADGLPTVKTRVMLDGSKSVGVIHL
jgi:Fe-S-cluster-containing dehydrogenase component